MFGRGFLFLGIILAAVAVPYVLSSQNGQALQPLARWWDSMWSDSLVGSDPDPSASPFPNRTGYPDGLSRQFVDLRSGESSPTVSLASRSGGTQAVSSATSRGAARRPAQFHQIGQVFQFSVTPAWLVQNWPSVSTSVENGLSGWRVPFVSGTAVHDLAGSLSYYFDGQQQLRRIAFQGTTGDPTQLVDFVSGQHGLQQYAALGGVLFLRQDGDVTTDALWIKLSPPRSRSQPNRLCDVRLELNRAEAKPQLSESFRRALEEDRKMLVTSTGE